MRLGIGSPRFSGARGGWVLSAAGLLLLAGGGAALAANHGFLANSGGVPNGTLLTVASSTSTPPLDPAPTATAMPASTWPQAALSSTSSTTSAAGYPAVTHSIDLTGTIQPAEVKGLSFGASGLVSNVAVHPGQTVNAGDVLARLDTANLASALQQAQSGVAQARTKLTVDQTAITSAETSLQNAQDGLATARKAASLSITQALANETSTATRNQQAADGALAQVDLAKVSLDNANTALQAAQSLARQQYADAQACVDQAMNHSGGPGGCTDLQQALRQEALTADQNTVSVNNAKGAVASAETALANVERALGDTLKVNDQSLLAAKSSASSTQIQAQQSVRSATGQVSSASTTLKNAQAQISVDQSALAAAQASEAAAQANLKAATLLAPFAGTVGQVNIVAGQSVNAGSGGGSGPVAGDVILIGEGGFEVKVNVPDTDIAKVHLGQQAVVTPAGALMPLSAVVSQITPIASSGSGVPTFPVTLTIQGNPAALFAGASADVSIQIGTNG